MNGVMKPWARAGAAARPARNRATATDRNTLMLMPPLGIPASRSKTHTRPGGAIRDGACRNLTREPGAVHCRWTSRADRFPVLDEVLGGPPGERLHGQRRIVRAARAHDGSAQNPEVRRFVRETPAADDVRLRVVAHARAAVRVRRDAH